MLEDSTTISKISFVLSLISDELGIIFLLYTEDFVRGNLYRKGLPVTRHLTFEDPLGPY